MFFLKAIASFLILPPTNLAVVVVIGFLMLPHWPCLGRWIVGTAGILLVLLGMPAVGNNLLLPLEQNLPLTPPPDAPPAAIVILSGDLRLTGGAQPGFTVGPLTLQRMRAGAELYRKTHLPILVSGGHVNPSAPPIGELMAQAMPQDFGVPVRWVEGKSRDTWENAQFSAAILHAAGIRSIYLVTQSWHERRALIAFRHAGLIATAAPTPINRFDFGLPGSLMPTASVWQKSYYALHEWVGCAWYSIP